MKIYFDILPENIDKVNIDDIGIFFNNESTFKGKQFDMRSYKFKNYYNYELFLEDVYKSNMPSFTLFQKNITSMCSKFLLRTFNFYNYISVGNILTFIDILDKIKKSTTKNQTLEFHLNNYPEIISVFKKWCKNNKIKYNLKIQKHIKRKSISFLKKTFFLRLFPRYISKLFRKKAKTNHTVFLAPKNAIQDIYASIKPYVSSYNILNYEVKNELYIMKTLIKNIFCDKTPYYSEFYDLNHYHEVLSTCNKHLKQVNKKIKINYKNIDISSESTPFFELLFNVYYILIIDSLLIGDKICRKYENVFFTYNDDPFLQAIALNDNKQCNKIACQYELIYPGCAYPILNKKTKLKINKELVWNNYSKNILVDLYNYPSNKVEVIGNIRFPKVKKSKSNKIRILFAGQPKLFVEVLDLFIAACKITNNDNLEFYIKPHPGESLDELNKKIGSSSITIVQGKINEALKKTDLLVTLSSTTVLEASYNNIPVIILNPYSVPPLGPPFYKQFTSFKTVKDFAKLLSSLNSVSLQKINTPTDWKIDPINNKKLTNILNHNHKV